MLFFEQLLRNFLLKKQVLIDFWATFAQLFEKLRETLKKKKREKIVGRNGKGNSKVNAETTGVQTIFRLARPVFFS